MNKLIGLDKVLRNFNKEIDKIKTKTNKGLMEASMFIFSESKRNVPVDLGFLRSSAYVEHHTSFGGYYHSTIGYTASYAVYVHENLNAKHGTKRDKFVRNGVVILPQKSERVGAKFLERVITEKAMEIFAIIKS